MIPFIGWYIISYIVFGILKLLKGVPLGDVLKNFFDVFITNDILNIPLWFLLALFWSNLFLYLASHCSKKPYVTAIIVFVISVIGMNLYRFSIPNFLYIGSAMSNLPYLYIGYSIAPKKENSICGRLILKNTSFMTAICFLVFLCIGIIGGTIGEEPPRLVYYNNTIAYGNLIHIYMCGISLVMSVILFSKLICSLPFITWLGKNSLIVLVSHLLVAPFTGTIIRLFWNCDNLVYVEIANLIVVLLLMLGIVPFCNRYLPFICARKK